jgi:hypothetical protein
MPLRSILLAALVLTVSSFATELSWPGRGTLVLDAPAGLSLESKQMRNVGFDLQATPKSGAAALGQFTLMISPPDKPLQHEALREMLHQIVGSYVSGSVEKTFSPQELRGKQGSGWIVRLTDASLVGKPPVKGDYKVMCNAVAALDAHTLVVATLQYDDPAGPESADLMALLSSFQFRPNPPALRAENGAYRFTVPESRLRLTIPTGGLEASEADPAKPSYFMLSQRHPNLIISGWFEPDSRYKGREKFWKSESSGPAFKGNQAPQNVAFLQVDGWEVVAYDSAIKEATNCHIRAELSRAGTWIDLHLSTTGDLDHAKAREQLLAALRTIRVEEK